MDKELYCRDTGLDCDFLACGRTEEEALSKLGQHVLAIHGIQGFSKEFYNKARSAIHVGYCDYGQMLRKQFRKSAVRVTKRVLAALTNAVVGAAQRFGGSSIV